METGGSEGSAVVVVVVVVGSRRVWEERVERARVRDFLCSVVG